MKNTIIETLEGLLGKAKVLSGDQLNDRYHHIWHMSEPLKALALILPASTEDVSLIMSTCHAHDQSVIVYGGLTNLVGATETNGDEVIISMEKMTNIEEVDAQSRTMTLQSGVLLENVQNAAKEKDLLFPLNFGAKGSAQMGGVISTNAGGLRVFRYGMTRNLILGLEAVLADGTIISSMKKIIKDNSGYDLKQLFIGSEGTLGVITRAVVKLVEAPKSRNSAFVGFDDYEKVISFLKFMDSHLAGTLSGYELIWKNTYQVMTSPPATTKPPLPYDYNYYVLLESLGSDQDQDRERLQELLEVALEKEYILDAVIAHTDSDLEWFWKIREDVHVIASQCDNGQHFDISVPIPLIGDLVSQIYDKIKAIPKVDNIYAFGHVADGNIHFIIGKQEQTEELINAINEVIYTPLQAIGGSVSAEHGIGLHKKKYLPICRTPEEIQLMKGLKKMMDPKGILNPGKILN